MNNQVLNTTQTQQPATTTPTTPTLPTLPAAPKAPGRFGRIFGGIVGGALNIVAPGAGTLIGSFINGGTNIGMDFSNVESLMAQSAQHQMAMITLQNRVQTNGQEFSTISNLLKSRHDGEMSAIQNIKG